MHTAGRPSQLMFGCSGSPFLTILAEPVFAQLDIALLGGTAPAQKHKLCDLPHIRLADQYATIDYLREGRLCPTRVTRTNSQALIRYPVSPWSWWPLLRSSS